MTDRTEGCWGKSACDKLGRGRLGALAVLVVLGFPLGACDDGQAVTGDGSSGGSGGVPGGAGVGDACTSTEVCRRGLVCNASGVCEPGGSLGLGDRCSIGAECKDGLQCSAGQCVESGGAAEGESCTGDASCASGLRCSFVGFGLQCTPDGTKDFGDECAATSECFAGLVCAESVCGLPLPGAPWGGTPFPGVACDAVPEAGPSRAFFEVPGAEPAGQEGDFFRLPYPNDVRRKAGKLDFDGFPTPGIGPLGFDPVKRYLDALGESESAWSTYPTVLFRFSGKIDFESLRPAGNGDGALNWVDITEGAPEYNSSVGLYWYVSEGSSKFVCAPWLGVRRPAGAPLVPGHTYAVWMTTAARDTQGNPVERSEHLGLMLAGSAPPNATLAAAHAAFAPFRAYLAAESIDPGTVLNATVITAATARDTMKSLADAVLAAPVPTAKSWVKCGGSDASPCPQAEADRACGSADPGYDEYHALVSLPIFQAGTAPYFDTGGGITTEAPVRNEDVCMSLTVPKGATMPAAGWPLVVFAHGTGGSFRSHVRAEVAGALSNAATPTGSVAFAVLGIDQVQHGPRRGDSDRSPNDLFFNFFNPAAARGNPLQGAADQIALARFAAVLDVTAGGDAIQIDPNAIVFFGHSQGSTHGSLALPYTDGYKALVLSGNGASLMHALLSKTKPVNIAAAVPFVLGDFDGKGQLDGGDMHPALTILQHWIDVADPLNFARAAGVEPLTGRQPKHLFQTYGLDDSYSPADTLSTYALAAGLELAAHDASVSQPDKIGTLAPQPVPLAGNVTIGTTPVTLVVRQYGPAAGDDGHFVAFDVPSANEDIVRFLGMAASGEPPQVGK